MKTLDPGLAAHLQQQLTTLTTCWRVVRADGQVFCFTEFDEDLVVEGLTYKAATGYTRSALSSELQYAVGNLDILGVFDDDGIKESEVRAGLFNGAELYISFVNWADPSSGHGKLHRGPLGNVSLTRQGVFTVQADGQAKRLQQTVVKYYQKDCRADLGDSLCKIPLMPPELARSTAYTTTAAPLDGADSFVRVADPAPGSALFDRFRNRIFECTAAGTTAAVAPAYSFNVGDVIVDGTATFTCREAWTRAGTIAAGPLTALGDHLSMNVTLDEPRAVDHWFQYGVITVESGENKGFATDVADWLQAGGQVSLFLEAPFPVAPGDAFFIWPGCDKQHPTCKLKFDNIVNRQAEDFVPGTDFLTTYADAR